MCVGVGVRGCGGVGVVWASVSCISHPCQVWQSEVVVSPTSPRALTDDLPTFSLSPLPYITEVTEDTPTYSQHYHSIHHESVSIP